MHLVFSHLDVLFNLCTSCIVLSVAAIYTYIYPKKNINLFFLLIVLSVLPTLSIFRKGIYESGDLATHIRWFISFFDSIKDGNIRPIWSSGFHYTYGHPLFIFIYLFPYYFALLFHLVGFSFTDSIKLVLATGYIASGIGMYVWLKNKLGRVAAFTGAIFYLFSPYHLVDLHFRNALGEIIVFAIIPFLFWFTDEYIKRKTVVWLFLISLFISLLILSHQAIAIPILPLLIIYIIMQSINQPKKQTVKTIISLLAYICLGILLSAWFWIPLLTNAQYSHLYPYTWPIVFTSLSDLLYSPWVFGFLFQGHHGELSYSIGYTQLLVVLLVVIFLLLHTCKKEHRNGILFFFCSFVVLVFFTQSQSLPMWNAFPLLKDFQFTYRLLLPIAFVTSTLAGYMTTQIKKKEIIVLLCFVTIGYTILNWSNRKILPQLSDISLRQSFPSSWDTDGGISVFATKWYNPSIFRIHALPQKYIEVVRGNAQIQQIEKNTTTHSYRIVAKTTTILRENTLYFPGWEATLDGKRIPIDYTNKKFPGIIILTIPKGIHDVTVSLSSNNVPGVKLGNTLSSTALTIMLALFFLQLKPYREKNIVVYVSLFHNLR